MRRMLVELLHAAAEWLATAAQCWGGRGGDAVPGHGQPVRVLNTTPADRVSRRTPRD